MVDELQLLITKYSQRAMIPTTFVIIDLQDLVNKQLNKKSETTLLEDLQQTYITMHGKIPARYKNDPIRLASKI